MYGHEYLDWRDKTLAGDLLDRWMDALPPETRVWVLAVMRDRHVTYRDGPGNSLQAAMDRQWQNISQTNSIQAPANQPRLVQSHYGSISNIPGFI